MTLQKTKISAGEFIDTRLRLYSAHSNIRGIPFIGDGFKQSQRKALWGMIKRGENADKDTVERIAAASASYTDYAHGVSSLEGTIVSMAQDFAGSNNMPIFEKHGQFGNRLNFKPGGSRYIKTKLHANFRKLFPKDDDLIFDYHESNGMLVEPKFFTPILPLVLLNGAEGMGTGHATFIMGYNPEDIKSAIVKLLAGKTLTPNSLVPWYNGFNGTITRNKETGQIFMEGKYEVKTVGRNTIIEITELPIGSQSDSYKAHLNKMAEKELIIDHDNLSDKNGYDFKVRVNKNNDISLKSSEEIKKLFKLVSKETENLTVWDGNGILKRYECVEDLLYDFVIWRTERYEDRRLAQIKKITEDIVWANLKIRFIKFYIQNHTYFRDTSNKELSERLVEEGFERHRELLDMPMRNLTKDKIAELEKEVDAFKVRLQSLESDDAISMYERELKGLKL